MTLLNFDSLDEGDMFSFKNEVYMKMQSYDDYNYNAVNLRTGKIIIMAYHTLVAKVIGVVWEF
jgi:hypothetical protein